MGPSYPRLPSLRQYFAQNQWKLECPWAFPHRTGSVLRLGQTMHPCYTVRPVCPRNRRSEFYRSKLNAARAALKRSGHAAMLAALVGSSLIGAQACLPQPSNASAEVRSLPEYKDQDATLFDDSVEPYAIGLSLDRPSSRGNSVFRSRAQNARSIMRMRIDTVTTGGGINRSVIRVGMKRVGKPLLGKDESEGFEVEVATGSNAFALFKQAGDRIQGRTVVCMWKLFRVNDEPTLHFYLAPDDDETLAAVRDAVALQELTGGK
ncbi:MAG: hypothetical protein U0165_18045 [Polyangiaceae bacterium]